MKRFAHFARLPTPVLLVKYSTGTINELAKAQRLIDSMDLHGLGYEMAMEQYRVLGEQLRRNLEEFTNGI